MKKKRTVRVVLTAVAAGLLLCAPKPQVVKAEGSWENVTEGGIIYQCVTDTESDMYEKALVYGVNDDFKSNGTIADIQSSVTDDKGKEYPVIAIGGELAGAFSGCTKLNKVNIPNSVLSIGEEAFNSSNPITMYGYTGSKAESYAKAKSNITFIALDKPVTIKNAYFSVTVPASWVGKYDLYTDPTEKTPSFVSFYSQKCYTETNGQAGWLFAIATFTDESYKELPAYKVLKKSGGQTYVFEEPTDVQTEGVSAEARAEYGDLLKDAEAICKTLKVTAAPNKPVIKSVKNTKGKKAKITIKKKISGAAGYEYSYDTSKKFKSAKSKSAKKTSLTLTKLKKKKTYYVRVRAYKTVNGAKIYSSWSAVKSVKIKK